MGNNHSGTWTQSTFRYATGGYLSLAEAKRMLLESVPIRWPSETLAYYCGMERSDKEALKEELTRLVMESSPEKGNKETIRRKIGSWVNDEVRYLGRQSVLQLAFAMEMNVGEADEMLRSLSGAGFHYRDPADIVMIYALRKKKGYQEAIKLQKEMEPLYRLPRKTLDDTETMTEDVREYVENIDSEEALKDFFIEYAPHLGKMHNTAYSFFMDFLNLLMNGTPERMEQDASFVKAGTKSHEAMGRQNGRKRSKDRGEADEEVFRVGFDKLEERKMSVSEVMETYLFNLVIPRGDANPAHTKEKPPAEEVIREAIKRDIRQNWPDETSLSRMVNRKIDVTRKALILLFLACDGGDSDYGDFTDITPENIFASTYVRLDSMLAHCGYPALDPRSPFDWMVLYCMTSDNAFDIDEKMLRFLSEIFKE